MKEELCSRAIVGVRGATVTVIVFDKIFTNEGTRDELLREAATALGREEEEDATDGA